MILNPDLSSKTQAVYLHTKLNSLFQKKKKKVYDKLAKTLALNES